MSIFNLEAVLSLVSDKFDKGLDDAEKKAKTSGNKISNAFKNVTKVAAGVTAGVGAAGAAIFGVAKKAADTTDHIDKMSQKLGLSREAYQELDFIMSQSGTSIDSLRGGMKTLTSAMDKANGGNKEAAAAFQRLGVSVTNADGSLRSQEEVMWDVMSALQSVGNDTEKATLANQLFGKSGQELMPLLNGEAGSIDDMRQSAHDLGLVLEDEAIDAGVHLTDTIDQVQRSFGAIVTRVGVEVMPLVQKFLDWVLSNMPTIQAVVGTAFDILSDVVKTAGDVLMGVFGAIQPYIPAIKDAFTNAVSAISDYWNNVLSPVFSKLWSFITETLAPDLMKAWNEDIGPAIMGVFESVSTFWTETLSPTLSAIWSYITETLAPDVKKAWDESIGPAIMGVFESVSTFWTETLSPAFTAMWSYITETLAPEVKTAWEETIGPAITTIMDAISTAWTDVLQPAFVEIYKKVGALKDKFKDVWETYIGPTVGSVIDGIVFAWNEYLYPTLVDIAKFVGAVKDTFKTVWEDYVGPIIDTVFGGIKTVWDEVLHPVFTAIAQVLRALRSAFETVWEKGIGPVVDSVFEGINTVYTTYLKPVFDGIDAALDTIKEAWDATFGAMFELIDDLFGEEGSITTAIDDGIGFIQEIFDGIDFSLPDVQLPHFVFDGWSQWGPISIPNIHVDWYKKAMDQPYMFTRPTLFGAGEAGDEVMYGRDNLMRDIRNAVAGAGGNTVTFNVYAAEGQDPEEIARAVQRQFNQWEDQRRAAHA